MARKYNRKREYIESNKDWSSQDRPWTRGKTVK